MAREERKDGTRKEGKWMMALPPTAIADRGTEHTEDKETHRHRRRQSCLF